MRHFTKKTEAYALLDSNLRMRPWASSLGICALAYSLTGCGGHVEGGGSNDPGESTSGKQPAPSNTSSSSNADNPDADTDLGDCTLGPLEYGGSDSDKPCPWATNNRCYETREMACNCACPRSHDSQCVSGFDAGADGHVLVSCF
jgi:hypothetical protein